MELVQYEKAYAINDNTSHGWVVTGQSLNKEDGISINWSAAKNGIHIGSFNYELRETMVHENISILAQYETEFKEYCKVSLENILTQMGENTTIA